ncbi:hypothetical protein DI09_37p130 [Mitosporidium daphniae]|uniref:Uncharacterized protein n=1 Tax=Mitosporidium daphniae TaxID=1485682 RepID=A0A098VUP4_9MICR|nr:uncharacterized protein DI09_37p130 [Mitosporidium daphniae]KGG51376.1 hypothetical protein DI09_37p130 [Mitosporidium daphniae]|eukprot:XP_013237803.1 uncharacterized protein DI09_37p130 [Mitosporidium daphniae]
MDRSFYFSPIMKILNNSESQNDARSLSATLGRDLPDSIAEDLMIKHLLLAFQGIDSSTFHFDAKKHSYAIDDSVQCTLATKELVTNLLVGASAIRSLQNCIGICSASCSPSLLLKMIKPWLGFVYNWMSNGGILSLDDGDDFFISENADVHFEDDTSWTFKYVLSDDLPEFVSLDDAKRIEAFIRHFELLPKQENGKAKQDHDALENVGSNFDRFSCVVQKIYTERSRLLFRLFFPTTVASMQRANGDSFWSHILFLKKVFFCERGDFCKALITSLASELVKPSVQVYRHNLVGSIDSIINEFLCPYDPSWLTGRLDVRLLKVPRWCSWFSPSPAIRNRKRDGNHLPLITRSILLSIWCLPESWKAWFSLFRKINSSRHDNVLLLPPFSPLVFNRVCTMITGMLSFIRQILFFIQIFTIGGAWDQFDGALPFCKTFDDVLGAHSAFISKVAVTGVFSTSAEGGSSPLRYVQQKLYQLLHLILAALYDSIVQKHLLTDSIINTMEERTRKGLWSISTDDEIGIISENNSINQSQDEILAHLQRLWLQFTFEMENFNHLLLDVSNEKNHIRPLQSLLFK